MFSWRDRGTGVSKPDYWVQAEIKTHAFFKAFVVTPLERGICVYPLNSAKDILNIRFPSLHFSFFPLSFPFSFLLFSFHFLVSPPFPFPSFLSSILLPFSTFLLYLHFPFPSTSVLFLFFLCRIRLNLKVFVWSHVFQCLLIHIEIQIYMYIRTYILYLCPVQGPGIWDIPMAIGT